MSQSNKTEQIKRCVVRVDFGDGSSWLFAAGPYLDRYAREVGRDLAFREDDAEGVEEYVYESVLDHLLSGRPEDYFEHVAFGDWLTSHYRWEQLVARCIVPPRDVPVLYARAWPQADLHVLQAPAGPRPSGERRTEPGSRGQRPHG